MIIAALHALFVSAAVAIAVWNGTHDEWTTAQATTATIVLAVSLGVAVRVRSGFAEPAGPDEEAFVGPRPASPAWLIPRLSVGDRSGRHVQTRTLPAARELAGRLLATRHGLDIADVEAESEVRRILGDEAWDMLRPDAPTRVDRWNNRETENRLTALVEGLERI